MKKLILMRHAAHAELGHVLSGRSQIPLNDRGRAQAAQLPALLSDMPICSLHSSPRCRALQTAAPLARARGLPVEFSPALDEIDFGEFTGKSFLSLQNDPDWLHWNAWRSDARCPGGETMREAADRATAYIDSLEPASFTALVVTHCDIIRALVSIARGSGISGLFDLDCEPASWSSLDVTEPLWRVLSTDAAC